VNYISITIIVGNNTYNTKCFLKLLTKKVDNNEKLKKHIFANDIQMSLYVVTRSPCNSYQLFPFVLLPWESNDEEEIDLKKIHFICLILLFGFFPLTILLCCFMFLQYLIVKRLHKTSSMPPLRRNLC
jgi:hypothetical protein